MRLNDPAQPIWTSRFFFLMASIGFAVGLGNIWRFPYVAGESGGGAFVLLYLLFAFSIGIPIVIAELLIGKKGRAGSVGSMRSLVKEQSLSSIWVGIGYLNQVAALLIQVTYAVIAGWVLFYFFDTYFCIFMFFIFKVSKYFWHIMICFYEYIGYSHT